MTDMTAFEGQVSGRIQHHAGPIRPVDDLAVFTAIIAAQSPEWRFQSMFSATKFVVAGAIVALFGGFLLAGVLTQQPSQEQPPVVGASASATTLAEPTDAATGEPEPAVEAVADRTKPDLLPGVDLATEEVEPGVYRVLSDGVRDLVRPADRKSQRRGLGDLSSDVMAGLDGSVWWLDRDGFFRLGEEAMHRWPEGIGQGIGPGRYDIEVGPDGTVWLTAWIETPGKEGRTEISSYDGQAWSKRWRGTDKRNAVDVEVQQDGTVWLAWVTERVDDRGGSVRVARLGDDDWEALPGSVHTRNRLRDNDLIASDESEAPLVRAVQRLRRHDGDDWVIQPTPDADRLGRTMRADVGPDGTLWVRLNPECPFRYTCASDILARFDGLDWAVFDSSDGIPIMGDHYQGFEGFFEVAEDRSIWFNPVNDYERTGTECDGIANFDGEAVTYFLRDTCIYAMDIAPDDTVWLQAGVPELGSPTNTYVITPEAVAAAE